MFAPILSFTAEEAWEHLPDKPQDSIFVCQWHVIPDAALSDDARVRWDRLLALRSDVSKELEVLRVAGKIGSSLAAEVELYLTSAQAERELRAFGDDLRFVFITSAAHVVTGSHADAVPSGLDGVAVRALPSGGKKCARCWHYRADTGTDPAHPELCGRCVSNLYGAGEPRSHA